MDQQKTKPEELLEFPCHYQFKAVGVAGEQFVEDVFGAVERHASASREALRVRPSGKGSYQAVSLLVTLHSYQQLTAIYADMKQISGVKMLL